MEVENSERHTIPLTLEYKPLRAVFKIHGGMSHLYVPRNIDIAVLIIPEKLIPRKTEDGAQDNS